jgi:nanoRNase/pAp phosphatase (c-di-AMP/oligoRNAs hydrolase)
MGQNMKKIMDLVDILKKEKHIYIQTHNFPDHDSVASAFGLQVFLKNFGINSFLVYDGEIQRDSLYDMIKPLNIEIKNISQYDMSSKDKIVIVDGCKGNKNVTDLIGDEVGVIDHHQVEKAEDVPFNDIRPDHGACSTIIFSYFKEYKVTIPQNVATALLIGINMDTSLLTRGVSEKDIFAYSSLYTLSDVRLVNSILRNFIQHKDLEFYREAIDKVRIKDGVAFCYFQKGCNQNMLGILGDFFLALKEVDFVVLAAKNNNRINFSLRNENSNWNCNKIIQEVLSGIGFGGGHSDMAGGIINDIAMFNEEKIYNKFLCLLN